MQKIEATALHSCGKWAVSRKQKWLGTQKKFVLVVLVYATVSAYFLAPETPLVEDSNEVIKAGFKQNDNNNPGPKTHEDPNFGEWLDGLPKGSSRSIRILEKIDLTSQGDLAATNPPPSCFVANVNKTENDIRRWPGEPSKPIINLGMPKCGTNTFNVAMKCLGFKSIHHMCDDLECGPCMKKAVANGLPPLSHCAKDVGAFSQINYNDPTDCVYPQITLLDEIHREAPNATYVLLFRPIEDWIRSVKSWDKMDERIATCELPMKPLGVGLADEELQEFFCRHVLFIREFVKHHPSHRLIEMELYEDNSELLYEIFPSRRKKHIASVRLRGALSSFGLGPCWSAKNVNKNLHTAERKGEKGRFNPPDLMRHTRRKRKSQP